jgi:hypothetical protein
VRKVSSELDDRGQESLYHQRAKRIRVSLILLFFPFPLVGHCYGPNWGELRHIRPISGGDVSGGRSIVRPTLPAQFL